MGEEMTGETPNQGEIDALIMAVRAREAEDRASMPVSPESYNFSRAGHLSHEQMLAIDTINDQFARNLTNDAGAWLRTQFVVNSMECEQKSFGSFMGDLPKMTYISTMRLEPLGTHGALGFDLRLAAPIVDVLLGGSGRAGDVRELTEIEEAILTSVTELIVRELNAAWQPFGTSFALEKREREGQISRLMHAREKTLCSSFVIGMPEAEGRMTICLPAVVLSTTLKKLITERDRPRRGSVESRTRMEELVADSRFATRLQFPPVKLSVRMIAEMEAGKILHLPIPQNTIADLCIGDTRVFGASPVRSGEQRAAQISMWYGRQQAKNESV